MTTDNNKGKDSGGLSRLWCAVQKSKQQSKQIKKFDDSYQDDALEADFSLALKNELNSDTHRVSQFNLPVKYKKLNIQ